ncbi:hypothetical protein Acy02nite_51830 [Actinoplanes cyaneus]|uniref:Lipoprotein n=1 Tax=Actinoplanes cyaneus TaxID=52696 RepID=A0A919IL96_9ACTN|nr:hypothetical protein [Actinoplanes cyaneus]MCW2141233.1 hypothetical protein [Actinoplanes cyaneus]GID67302.1 hypothetical protein Acy02nite_51830 [Actinoplanes cyaneus]
MKRFLIALVLLLAGCTSAEAARPAVCDSWDSVQNTVDHIRDVNVSASGLSALRPYLSQLRTGLNQLYADAKTQFSVEADALRVATDQLATSLRVAKDNPDVTNLAAVRASVGDVRTTANTLHNAMLSTC